MTDLHSINGWSQQSVGFSPDDASFQWDFTRAPSPQNMVSHYNDLLQRAADFYASLDHSLEGISSSNSDRSCPSSPQRRISSTSTAVTQVANSIPDKIERRREQNRSSQRAYRERKERRQKELEEQIAQWQQKHQLLCQSYSQQSKEVARLQAQIKQLNDEIFQLQSGLPALYGSLGQFPQEFDLVPFYVAPSASPEATPQPSPASPSRSCS
ncbi:hypothetical protein A1O3_09804 [Capronia epimyces CBS 606.96]|uniref:BZIP domain-containing protein n=1 Tax=Capronia epimyces CBS 606.96 TaxID=1182542 RepID=W9XAR9_9EURO|nr:uncharacterized protein A1O3_09804 [Capronia epimyces CBS 606.96]EXJ77577.1 hypothetical protein A1O3_09804 [Capronia epimyces CBS 606.96]